MSRDSVGEAATAVEFFGYLRDGVVKKALGPADDVARTPAVPSGTSLAWVVKHLTVAEEFRFAGTPVGDWRVASTPDEPVADLVAAAYRRTGERSDAIISAWADDLGASIDDTGNGRPITSRRWVVTHLLTETARHAGHSDILRERIDGAVGR